MATKDPTDDFQAQILDGIRKSQAAVVEGLRSWTETVQQLVPTPGRTAWPGSEQFPTVGELVDSVFDFATQLLNAQREFAHSVLAVAAPVGEQAQEKPEKPTQPAPRTTKST